VPIFRRFWDIARYWSKIAYFTQSVCLLVSPIDADPIEILTRSLVSKSLSPWAIVWRCVLEARLFRGRRSRSQGTKVVLVWVFALLWVLASCNYILKLFVCDFGTIPACDRRIDRHTTTACIYRASIASRGKLYFDARSIV